MPSPHRIVEREAVIVRLGAGPLGKIVKVGDAAGLMPVVDATNERPVPGADTEQPCHWAIPATATTVRPPTHSTVAPTALGDIDRVTGAVANWPVVTGWLFASRIATWNWKSSAPPARPDSGGLEVATPHTKWLAEVERRRGRGRGAVLEGGHGGILDQGAVADREAGLRVRRDAQGRPLRVGNAQDADGFGASGDVDQLRQADLGRIGLDDIERAFVDVAREFVDERQALAGRDVHVHSVRDGPVACGGMGSSMKKTP